MATGHGAEHLVRRLAFGEQDVALAEVTLRHERLEPVERWLAEDRLAQVPDQDDHLIEPITVHRQCEGLQRHRKP